MMTPARLSILIALILSAPVAFAHDEAFRGAAEAPVSAAPIKAPSADSPALTQLPALAQPLSSDSRADAAAPAAPAAATSQEGAPAAETSNASIGAAQAVGGEAAATKTEPAAAVQVGATDRALARAAAETSGWNKPTEAVPAPEAGSRTTSLSKAPAAPQAAARASAPVPPPASPQPKGTHWATDVLTAVSAFAVAAALPAIGSLLVVGIAALYGPLKHTLRRDGAPFDHAAAAERLSLVAWAMAVPTLFHLAFGMIFIGMPHSHMSGDFLLPTLLGQAAAFLGAYFHRVIAKRQAGENPAIWASVGAFAAVVVASMFLTPLATLLSVGAVALSLLISPRPAAEKAAISRAAAWGYGAAIALPAALEAAMMALLGMGDIALVSSAVAAAAVGVALIPSWLFQRQAKDIVR